MNLFLEYSSQNMSAAHIQAFVSLTSIISSHFLVRSYTLVTDLDPPSILNFQKMASNYFFSIEFEDFQKIYGHRDFERSYLIIQKSGLDLMKILKYQPKLVVTIFITNKTNPSPSEFYPEVIIPPQTSFFVVLMSEYLTGFSSSKNLVPIQGKCFRLYKPAYNFTTKIFSLMYYDGLNESRWYWLNKKKDWNSYVRDVRNLSEITVTIALATPREKNTAVNDFLKSKNSFFWRAMADFLKFRIVVHVESISPQAIKSVTSVYLKLLMTVADGLGVLPVMSSERNHQSLKFLVTGLDSKYHLMVRAPHYVYSWQSTLKPFSLEAWLCLALTILLISFILRVVTYKERSKSTNESCCFLMIFGFICSQGCPNISKNISARLVCYTALLFSIVIYQFYTSNFCSMLSTKEVKIPFTSLEQLIAKRTHSLYVHPETAIYTQILKAESGIFKKLYDKILKKDPFHQLKSVNREKSFDKVCKGTGAILGLPFQIIYMKELWCPLIPVNSGYFPASIGTAIRNSFPFQSQFKFVHLRLLEAGVTHKFRDEFLNFKQQRLTKADVTNEPVSLNNVAFLFVFYAAFVVLSFLTFFFEIVFFKSFKKTNKRFSNGNLFLRKKATSFD